MTSSGKDKKGQLGGLIVQSLAASIQNLDPIDEICDMLVESSGYRKTLYSWKDPHTGLNLLQLAVVSKHLDVVRMFCMEKHKESFKQTWHGEYYNPLLHLACKVGSLNIIRYLVEQQNADLTAEGIVTYPHPVDTWVSGASDSPPALSNLQKLVFVNRKKRNYLSLQGDHKYDISYGAGHRSFAVGDEESVRTDSCHPDRKEGCLAGPSGEYKHVAVQTKSSGTESGGLSGRSDEPSGVVESFSGQSMCPTNKTIVGERRSLQEGQTRRSELTGPTTSQSSSHQWSSPCSSLDTCVEKLKVVRMNSDQEEPTCHIPEDAKHAIGQTPYQICVLEGHVLCANYLCMVITNRMEKPIYHIHDSPLLHKVTYLGCAQHLHLLLKRGYRKHINTKDCQGHMPIHIACLTANPECAKVLLQNGATVNSRADHRTCLQIMYWSKFRPENFVQCSELLVRYGTDVNAMDHNNNTALDYLAWELGQKWYQISKAWVKTHRIAEINNFLQPAAHLQEHILSDDEFRQEIFCCMQLLLIAGASTLICNRDDRVDHTIVHTLLQNTGWPLNSSLRKRPMEVYKALDLFFHYGADPNVIARNNNESAMTMLLMHSLHEIPNELKVKFVALFLMNGANLECLIPEPKQYRENYSDRRWNIYPVMVALQERHPIDVVRLLYDFMSLRHVYHSLRMTEDKFLWHRMTWSLGGVAKDNRYREQWLAIRNPRVRTLRHCCKLAVFKTIGRRAVLVDELPLPRPLKRYLQDIYS